MRVSVHGALAIALEFRVTTTIAAVVWVGQLRTVPNSASLRGHNLHLQLQLNQAFALDVESSKSCQCLWYSVHTITTSIVLSVRKTRLAAAERPEVLMPAQRLTTNLYMLGG